VWGQKSCVQGFGEETCGKEQPGKPRCGWEDGINIVLKEIVWEP